MQEEVNARSNTWTNEEFLAGACSHLEIGQPKNLPSPPQDGNYGNKLADLGEAALDVVLSHPGGPRQWFRENPAAHSKLLVKLATPIQQGADSIVNVNISWLSPERLSYKHTGPVSDPMDVVAKPALPDGWKPLPEDPLVAIGVNSLIKDSK